MTFIEVAFWLGLATVAYAHGGYGVLLALLSHKCPPRAVRVAPAPRVSLIIAACDEEQVLAAKLENTLDLDYPSEQLEIIVVADGSRDNTRDVAASYASSGVRVIFEPERRGKNHAMNRAVNLSDGEIIVFTDANTILNRQALRALTRHFADPQVALVAGAKHVVAENSSAAAEEGLYWRYESWLKTLEARFSSVMGAAGEIFAVRRNNFEAPPSHAIIEDFWLTMSVIRQGFRVAYEPHARATEYASPSMQAEWVRKSRIAAGGWQAVAAFADQLHPRRGRVAFQFFSHRVLRWIVVPVLLPILFSLNLTLARHPLYATLLVLQATLYTAALLGWWLEKRGPLPRWLAIPCFFFVSHLACLQGGWRHWRRTQPTAWERIHRGPELPRAS